MFLLECYDVGGDSESSLLSLLKMALAGSTHHIKVIFLLWENAVFSKLLFHKSIAEAFAVCYTGY